MDYRTALYTATLTATTLLGGCQDTGTQVMVNAGLNDGRPRCVELLADTECRRSRIIELNAPQPYLIVAIDRTTIPADQPGNVTGETSCTLLGAPMACGPANQGMICAWQPRPEERIPLERAMRASGLCDRIE